jgi:hypothetical protein
LTPQQLEERKEKGLCFNCDNKYSKGHKCGEKKLFYIDCEEEEEQEQEPSQDENVEAISSEELTTTISCNALARISTPQTLKIEGYIKKKKVIVLIDSGSTHNFILLVSEVTPGLLAGAEPDTYQFNVTICL